jgi:Flp pilus assembly protein TadD
LTLITLLVYIPSGGHEFINYDDPAFVVENPNVRNGLTPEGIRWAFSTTETGNWQPVTWLTHMLDCQLFGLDAGPHHLVNVALHVANTVLLFVLLRFLTSALWPSALVAALFAWHPLRVQSVAWVAERKDVLCAFFALLSLLVYVRYAKKRSGEVLGRRPWSYEYSWVVVFLALGLMAKPMLVTLPFAMLLLDYWPLARLTGTSEQRNGKGTKPSSKSRAASAKWSLRQLLIEKWPLFALSALFCWLTVFAQSASKAVASFAHYPVDMRLKNVVLAYGEYLLKTVYPTNLAVFYPLPRTTSRPALLGVLAVLVLISWAAWHFKRRRPWLLMGWFWFVGMLVPVSGLVQVGDQFFADRYTYLPSIGLCVAVVFGLAEWVAFARIRVLIASSLAACVLAGCLWSTTRELAFWKDSDTLFTRALAVTHNNFVALNNLGAVLLRRGQTDEAIDLLKQAVVVAPADAEAQNNLGLTLVKLGQLEQAEPYYRNAIQVNPRYRQAYENLGSVYLQTKRLDQAIASLKAAIAIQPSAKALNDLGVACMRSGRAAEGLESFRQAVNIEPGNAQYRRNLGLALAEKGKFDEAMQYVRPR